MTPHTLKSQFPEPDATSHLSTLMPQKPCSLFHIFLTDTTSPQTQCSALQNLKDLIENNLTAVLKHNQELTEQRTSCTITEDEHPICAHDWMSHGKKCYYFSNESLTWVESGAKCVSMGGQLVIIDSQNEQTFLDQKIGAIMSDGEDKFWIGLTDQKEEGKWLWVDNTPLDSNKSFWTARKSLITGKETTRK
uniref:C-type lectin domain-containing protein n=1 Tax=Hucho hucho TaxID=62062 RepID=A0A4W5L3M4_9TELE